MDRQLTTRRDIVMGFANAMNLISPEVENHHEKVSYLAYHLAETMGLNEQQRMLAFFGGLLHDIGGVLKPGNVSLTELEASAGLVAAAGASLLRSFPVTLPFAPTVQESQTPWQRMKKLRAALKVPQQLGQIIHLADTVDVYLHFGRISEKDREQVERFVLGNRGIMFSPRIVDLFMETFDTAMVKSVEEMGVTRSLRSVVPEGVKDFSPKEIQGITDFFAGIVDDKSSFTRDHSVGVARKAEEMARFYGWSEEKAERFRFAGAFHDIGKLVVNNDILEKPGRLTGDEFLEMQNHASQTYKVLSGIRGCEDITEWAANHHEKLDGSGYPRGLTEQQLSFEDRLMACIDVYQALREKRPYKDGLTHSRTIAVMRDMAARRKLDGGIIRNMDRVFGTQTGREVS